MEAEILRPDASTVQEESSGCPPPPGYTYAVEDRNLGQGSFGSVQRLCKEQDCKYAGKNIRIARKDHETFAARDLYFLYWLTEYCQGEDQIAPYLYDVRKCTPHSPQSADQVISMNVVMEVFDGDLAGSSTYEMDIFKAMFDLLFKLRSRLIVHGDIKPDQFLWNKDGKVVLTDYGFSGQLTEQQAVKAGIAIEETNASNTPPSQWQSAAGVFVPLLGWVKNSQSDMKCLQDNNFAAAQPMKKGHPFYPFLPWLDLLMLDCVLLLDRAHVVDEDGAKHAYGGVKDDAIFPESIWQSFTSFCDFDQLRSLRAAARQRPGHFLMTT